MQINVTGSFPFSTANLIIDLTAWSRFLLEKLIVPQLVKRYPTFYGTEKFHYRVSVFVRTRHLSEESSALRPILFL
jgi:hypothetical protein